MATTSEEVKQIVLATLNWLKNRDDQVIADIMSGSISAEISADNGDMVTTEDGKNLLAVRSIPLPNEG